MWKYNIPLFYTEQHNKLEILLSRKLAYYDNVYCKIMITFAISEYMTCTCAWTYMNKYTKHKHGSAMLCLSLKIDPGMTILTENIYVSCQHFMSAEATQLVYYLLYCTYDWEIINLSTTSGIPTSINSDEILTGLNDWGIM